LKPVLNARLVSAPENYDRLLSSLVFLHCELRPYSAGVESSGNGQAAALVNGARWVAGMPAQRVPVKNIRLSLNHDESGVRP